MDENILKSQLSTLKSDIESRIDKANEQAKEAGNVAQEVKSEITNAINKWNETSKLTQDQVDGMATDLKKIKEGVMGSIQVNKSFAERIAEHKGFADYKARNTNTTGNIEMKSAGIMTNGDSITDGAVNGFIAPTRLNSIVPIKREQFNIRQLFSTIPMTGNIFAFPQETAVDGVPTMTEEGALKPATDNDFELKEAPARKLAHHKRISEELLNDIPALAGFLQTYGVQELLKVEDTQLLAGGGTGQNLSGIALNALTDANFSGTSFATMRELSNVADTTTWDCLIAILGLLAANKHTANTIVMNPADWYIAIASIGTDGHYINKNLVFDSMGAARFMGIPISLSTSVTQGTLYVGDSNAAQIAQREGISVRLYDQDQDNAVKNLVTVVIEERLAFPIYYPTAFYVDTIANTKTAISTLT
jgi:HK97 family phage major capsid protein